MIKITSKIPNDKFVNQLFALYGDYLVDLHNNAKNIEHLQNDPEELFRAQTMFARENDNMKKIMSFMQTNTRIQMT